MAFSAERVHFVGIGGAGMSSLAELLLARGVRVTGSDRQENAATGRLRILGAKVHIGHRPERIGDPDVVVYSSAVPSRNCELQMAHHRGLPVLRRGELLAALMNGCRGLAVAGTHGKTTTTAMLASILEDVGLDPTVVLGGRHPRLGGGARHGAGAFFVAEADESDGSFLQLSPEAAIVTNVDSDHLDFYGERSAIEAAFAQFAGRLPRGGALVYSAQSDTLVRIARDLDGRKRISFGVDCDADVAARQVHLTGLGSGFQVWRNGSRLGDVQLHVPGLHNVADAVAAVALSVELEIPFRVCAASLSRFVAVARRFEIIGEVDGVVVVHDYAHHPAEVRATLAAARAAADRVIAVFQPHLYSRTAALCHEFAQAFADADRVVITEVYGGREQFVPGVTGKLISDGASSHHPDAAFVPELEHLSDHLVGGLRPGDYVLFLGAGDVWRGADMLLRRLRARDRALEGSGEEVAV